MNFDWDKLRVFHIVAEIGSFTHAGDKLKLSQSAVSRQISALEESMKVALFHRHPRGLILSEQGELLYKTTREIFEKLNYIDGQIQDSRQLADGPLLVTMAEFIGMHWIIPHIQKFREEHPEIQLTFLFDNRALNLGMREADIAIRLTNSEQQDLIQRHLTDIHFHICASKDYINKHGKPECIDGLIDHRIIAFPELSGAPYEKPNWFLEHATIPATSPNVMLLNSISAIFRSVKSGAGIAELPDFLIDSDNDLEVVLENTKGPPVPVYFVYAEERRNSERLVTFRDFLLNLTKQTRFRIE